jgi:hypothetical protein
MFADDTSLSYSSQSPYTIEDVMNSALESISIWSKPGADPGFQVRGAHIKKIAPSGGRRENFCCISWEKSRF